MRMFTIFARMRFVSNSWFLVMQVIWCMNNNGLYAMHISFQEPGDEQGFPEEEEQVDSATLVCFGGKTT